MRRKLSTLFAAAAAIVLAGCATCTDKEQTPRNLIYMIGDGMGLSHAAMLIIENDYEPTAFDRAQNVALATTYSLNNRVTDSAASGTALATGTKTNNSMLGITPDSVILESIIARAEAQGRPTGIVVTSDLGHATPAAFYAHTFDRGNYATIARQFVDSGIDVAFGGGASTFSASSDPETPAPLDLLREKGYGVVTSLEELEAVTETPVIGLMDNSHMISAQKGRGDYLPRATSKALELLTAQSQKSGQGFVLMVEGSRIDFEAHDNNAEGLLLEMRDFEQAVSRAMDYADTHPGTLVVVVADHETGGLSMSSGNPDFTLSESGIDYRFSTSSHTGIPVPVYLYGTGAERINGLTDNAELSNRLSEILGLDTKRP